MLQIIITFLLKPKVIEISLLTLGVGSVLGGAVLDSDLLLMVGIIMTPVGILLTATAAE